ncbi:unnamed protein product [Symbiodinium natans]|uniref:Uncharacterized protein n=1 Tax=Symbiodinium natans TaxID=878477 RepID=A0A812Q1U6_9DINO|nr:unnamed protein product [Symbiodinium natans]
MAILKDVLFKLDRYAARELPELVSVLHHMTWNDKQLFKIVEPRLLHELPSVSLEDIPRIAESFVGVGCGSRMLFQEMIHLSLQAARHFTPQQVASLVASFSKSPYKPKAFLMSFCPTVAANLHHFDALQLTRVVVAYSEWPGEVSTDFMEQVMEVLCFGSEAMTLQDMPAPSLVAVLRALALWRSRSKSVREHPAACQRLFSSTFCLAAAPLSSGCHELTGEELAQAMWAYGRTRYVPTRLFAELYNGVRRSFKVLSLPSLASCLLNSGRALSGQLRFWDDSEPVVVLEGGVRMPKLEKTSFSDRQLLTDAETLVVRRLGGVIPRDLASVVLGYSLAHAGSAELFSVLQRACLERCPQFPPEQMSRLLWSFATVRLGPALAKEAQVDLLECLPQLTAPAVSDLLWAYCALRHRDPHFFKALLGVLSPSTVANNPRCAQLCPALLDIRIHFPEMDPEGLGRYLSYVQPTFLASQRRIAAAASAVADVTKALESLGMRGRAYAEVDGYVVDVLVSAEDAGLAKPAIQQVRNVTAPWFCDVCAKKHGGSQSSCCGCFPGYVAILANLQMQLWNFRAFRQADAKALSNATEAMWRYRLKLRPGKDSALARAAFRERFGTAQDYLTWKGRRALCFLDETCLEQPEAHALDIAIDLLTIFRLTQTVPSYKLQVENHNVCLLDIWAGKCEKSNLPIFEHFPAVQGPSLEGYTLDFLGVTEPLLDCAILETKLRRFAPVRTMPCKYLEICRIDEGLAYIGEELA